jgi:transposase-like protein
MKRPNGFPRRRSRRTNGARRARLLAAFDHSGLSAAAFARQHGLNYTTFCGWRQRQAKTKPAPDFVQIEVPRPAASDPLVIELAAGVRIRINSAGQIELAVRLLQSLNPTAPC